MPLLPLLLLLPLLVHSYGYYYDELNELPPPCSSYEMMIVNTRQCVRRCPIECDRESGVCFEAGDCPCANQYVTSFEEGLLCAAECLPGCREAGGHCASSDLCLCRKEKHFFFDPVAKLCRRRRSRLLDLCRGRCINGSCSYKGDCVCAEGFELRASLKGQVCMPICEHDCGPRAFCFAPNLCACRHKHQHFDANGKCSEDYR